jgi:cytochrome c oxidase assembly protein subunit 15
MQNTLFRLSVVSLICIFLVILAGSIVRMTDSGMGCPDWPKCFGYYIPPTDIETLTWRVDREFDEGNIIIRDDALFVARADFTSGAAFDQVNWQKYTRHSYSIFNPTHTWVEYINRLIGAFTGLPVLALFLISIFRLKRDPVVTLLAFLGVLLLGFEAWLGKIVVDGNLVPHQITYHMFGALALVALYTFLVVRLQPSVFTFQKRRSKKLVRIGLIAVALLLVQIYLGTSVREEVDAIGKSSLLRSPDWFDRLSIYFEFHRTFSVVVLGIVGYFCAKMMRTRDVLVLPQILLALLVAEVLIGIGLAYLDLPGVLQPLHLLFAVADFSLLMAIIFNYRRKTTLTALA